MGDIPAQLFIFFVFLVAAIAAMGVGAFLKWLFSFFLD